MKKRHLPIILLCVFTLIVSACNKPSEDPTSSETQGTSSEDISSQIETGGVTEEPTSSEDSQESSEVDTQDPTSSESQSSGVTPTQAPTATPTQGSAATPTPGAVGPTPTVPAVAGVDNLDKMTFNGVNLKRILWYTLSAEETKMVSDWEKKTGAKITNVSVAFANINDRISTSIVSGDPIDIGWIYGAFFPGVVIQNLYEPVNKYIGANNLVDYNNPSKGGFDLAKMQNFIWKGNYYGLASYYDVDMLVLYYNKRMFSDYGVKTPLQYAQEGTWNWSNFRKVAEELTEGNVYGLQGGLHESTWLLATGAQVIKYDNSGNPSENLSDPKVLEAFNFIRGMYGHGNTKFADTQANFRTANAAMFIDGLYEIPKLMTSSNALQSVKDNWEVAPIPLSPSNTAKLYPVSWLKTTGITKGTKNPDAVASFALFKSAYVPDNLYMEYMTQAQISRVEPYYRNVIVPNQSYGEINIILGQIIGRLRGGSDPAQEISENKPIFTSEIDKVMRS